MAEIIDILNGVEVRRIKLVGFRFPQNKFSFEEVDSFDPHSVISSMEIPRDCFSFTFFYRYETSPCNVDIKEGLVLRSENFPYNKGKNYFFSGEVYLSADIVEKYPDAEPHHKQIMESGERVVAAKQFPLKRESRVFLYPFKDGDEVLNL